MRTLIRHQRRRMVAYLLLALAFAASSYLGDTSRRGLCAQRTDLDQRIALTDTYLNPKTPEQRRAARQVFSAIPRAAIVDGQRRSRETRRNLDVVICSWSEVLP